MMINAVTIKWNMSICIFYLTFDISREKSSVINKENISDFKIFAPLSESVSFILPIYCLVSSNCMNEKVTVI